MGPRSSTPVVGHAFLVGLLLVVGCDFADRQEAERAAMERARAEAAAAQAAAEARAEAEARAAARAEAEARAEAARVAAGDSQGRTLVCPGVPVPEELEACESHDDCKTYYVGCRIIAGRADQSDAIEALIDQCEPDRGPDDDCLGMGLGRARCSQHRCDFEETFF